MVYRLRPLEDEMERVINKLGIKSGRFKEAKIVLNGISYIGGVGLRVIVSSVGKMPSIDSIKRRRGSTKLVLEFSDSGWEEVCELEESLDGSMMLELLCNNMDSGRHKFIPLCKIYTGCVSGHRLFKDDINRMLGSKGVTKIYKVGERVILVVTIA